MYLKFIRQHQPCGSLCRGTLYSVHFQPNEKGGYNEHLTCISDAYEIPCDTKSSIINHKSQMGGSYPLPLIYSVGVRRTHGHLRLALGTGNRQSMLHLINRDARERLFADVLDAIHQQQEVRIEVCDNTHLNPSNR